MEIKRQEMEMQQKKLEIKQQMLVIHKHKQRKEDELLYMNYTDHLSGIHL